MSKNTTTLLVQSVAIPFILVSASCGQAQQQPTPTLQQKLQWMQQAAATSERQLHTYQWLESTTLTIDGLHPQSLEVLSKTA